MELKPKLSLLLPLLLGSLTARADQRYITLPGVYGSVTVTESGCPPSGSFNPFTAAGRVGLALTTNTTCTLTFSHPIPTASITIDIDGHTVGDLSYFSLNGTPYSPVSGDLTAPLSPALLAGSVSIAGSTITGNGSGTLRFTSSPPESITSLSITIVPAGFGSTSLAVAIGPGGSGTFFRVGFDDTPGPAAVPTLSEWGIITLALGLTLLVFHRSKLAAC